MNEFNLLIRGKEVDFVCLCSLLFVQFGPITKFPKAKNTSDGCCWFWARLYVYPRPVFIFAVHSNVSVPWLIMHWGNYISKAKSCWSKSNETTEKRQLPPWKTAVVANRTCHPWPTSKSLWLALQKSMESEKCELAKGEKEQLGTKETAETLLALVDESADEQGLTATRLKIQTAKRHFPLRQAKPSKMTVYGA